jgi:hypothetical protein
VSAELRALPVIDVSADTGASVVGRPLGRRFPGVRFYDKQGSSGASSIRHRCCPGTGWVPAEGRPHLFHRSRAVLLLMAIAAFGVDWLTGAIATHGGLPILVPAAGALLLLVALVLDAFTHTRWFYAPLALATLLVLHWLQIFGGASLVIWPLAAVWFNPQHVPRAKLTAAGIAWLVHVPVLGLLLTGGSRDALAIQLVPFLVGGVGWWLLEPWARRATPLALHGGPHPPPA